MTVAFSIFLLSVVIALGKILGGCRIGGISLGVTWILFVGILFAHFGYCPDAAVLHFVKELGLIFFVYSIGMQVGPDFFSHFRSGGIRLNLLALLLVLLGVATADALAGLTGIPMPTMVGIMSGAVTNTPGLGAAQQACADGGADIATGYAVAYPFGMAGCILSLTGLRKLFRRGGNGRGKVRAAGPEAAEGAKTMPGTSLKDPDDPHLIPMFIGIALGCLLGSLPIRLPGLSQPVRLGLAGGPLILSILLGSLGPRLKIATCPSTGANLMVREIGISLFLACVGLEAGGGFVAALTGKGGPVWVGCGALVTLLPLVVCGTVGRCLLNIGRDRLAGVLAGAMTNPPALAFATEQEENGNEAAVGYATVYPLAMFLRVLAAQLMIAV